jgi:hypothetical protein
LGVEIWQNPPALGQSRNGHVVISWIDARAMASDGTAPLLAKVYDPASGWSERQTAQAAVAAMPMGCGPPPNSGDMLVVDERGAALRVAEDYDAADGEAALSALERRPDGVWQARPPLADTLVMGAGVVARDTGDGSGLVLHGRYDDNWNAELWAVGFLLGAP